MKSKKIIEPLKKGMVVQLDPEKVLNKAFAGCMMTIDSVKKDCVRGYIQGIGGSRCPGGRAYYMAYFYEFQPVGTAVWVV